MPKSRSGTHAAQNRFAVIAQANGVVRILQRFSTRTEAEAFIHVSQKTPGIGQLSIQDLAAPAAPARAPEFTSQAELIRARREEERRQRPVSPQLLLSVLLLFAILLGGLGLLYVVNEYVLPGM